MAVYVLVPQQTRLLSTLIKVCLFLPYSPVFLLTFLTLHHFLFSLCMSQFAPIPPTQIAFRLFLHQIHYLTKVKVPRMFCQKIKYFLEASPEILSYFNDIHGSLVFNFHMTCQKIDKISIFSKCLILSVFINDLYTGLHNMAKIIL